MNDGSSRILYTGNKQPKGVTHLSSRPLQGAKAFLQRLAVISPSCTWGTRTRGIPIRLFVARTGCWGGEERPSVGSPPHQRPFSASRGMATWPFENRECVMTMNGRIVERERRVWSTYYLVLGGFLLKHDYLGCFVRRVVGDRAHNQHHEKD